MKTNEKVQAAMIIVSALFVAIGAQAGPMVTVEAAPVASIGTSVAPATTAVKPLTLFQVLSLGNRYIPMSGEYIPVTSAPSPVVAAIKKGLQVAAHVPNMFIYPDRYEQLSAQYSPFRARLMADNQAALQSIQSFHPSTQPVSATTTGTNVVLARLKKFLDLAGRGTGSIPFDAGYRGNNKIN